MTIDHHKFRDTVKWLYSTVSELKEMFPDRHFTPDGHLVGSIGECLVADAYNLRLKPASNEGYDAESPDGKKVEIKATQSKSVAFRSESEYAIVIQIRQDGTFKEIYNGPGKLIWKQFDPKKEPKNGQFKISLNRLEKLTRTLNENEKIPRIN